MPKRSPRRPSGKAPPFRFAHPFFTTVKPEARTAVPGTRETRMLDHIKKHLEKIPPVKGDSIMTLSDIVGSEGAAAIEAAGALSFHAVGDTGKGTHTEQETVALAMAADYDTTHPAKSPAFLFHLGDVIYFNNTELGYYEQFYTPYKHYPGKIIGIPGNHDGEVLKGPGGQKKTLTAFKDNFCRATPGIPPAAKDIFREMVAQPGIYWMLDTPFLWIIALYSNVAENPGFISDPTIGTTQKKWLAKRLKEVRAARKSGTRKGLLLATHHPPYSSGGHSGSKEMLADIDDSCRTAGVFPDVFLAAHAHNEQRHMRTVQVDGKDKVIPYFVAGGGGRGLTTVAKASSKLIDDHVFAHSHRGFGYLTVVASHQKIIVKYESVPVPNTQPDHDGATVSVP